MTVDHADPAHAGQLHHVELYAADVDASADFWGWLLGELGYEPIAEWGAVGPGSTGRRTSCWWRPM